MANQHWSAAGYAANARYVADLGASLIDLLHPQPHERILDLGCGDGYLTEQIAARGAVCVGVDASIDMIAAARVRGLDARVIDGRALAFEAEFDAVFSNAALHWMDDPDAVLSGVRRALCPGGRFVAEFGGKGNVAAIVTAISEALYRRGIDAAARNPWYFPAADDYRARLERRGFAVERIGLFPRPTPLPTGIEGWLETFAGPFLGPLEAAARDAVVAEVTARVAPQLCQPDGTWIADYVRLRVLARLP